MATEDYGLHDFDVIPTRIEEVQPGWSLVIQHQGHAVLFQVHGKGMSYVEQQGTIYKLEYGMTWGRSWCINYAAS